MSEVRYLHFRLFNPFKGGWQGKGGLTYAYREENGGVRWAYAQCSLKDNYEKEAGRALARERLDDPERSTFAGGDNINLKQFPFQLSMAVETNAYQHNIPLIRKFSRKRRKSTNEETNNA